MRWRIHFFRRSDGSVPARDFLDALPPKVRQQAYAVLAAVADAPPPSYSGGGKWEAMRGEMAGLYEVRVQESGMNHRLFCVLDRGLDLGGGSIVCLGGLSKRARTAADERDYRRVRRYADEFRRHRRVLA